MFWPKVFWRRSSQRICRSTASVAHVRGHVDRDGRGRRKRTAVKTVPKKDAAAMLALVNGHAGATIDEPTIETDIVIDDEFSALIYPTPNEDRVANDNVQGREATKAERLAERRELRNSILRQRLATEDRINPFKVWQDGERLVLIDGRDDEHAVALELGMAVEYVETEPMTRDEARTFVITEALIGEGRPNYTTYYAIELALKCKGIKMLAAAAKANQGRRTDLLARAPKSKSLNTRAAVAALADCGEGLVGKVKALKEKGTEFLGSRWEEIENALRWDDMKITGAHKKLMDAIDAQTDSDLYSENHLPTTTDDSSAADDTNAESSLRSLTRNDSESSEPIDNPILSAVDYENAVVCGDCIDVLNEIPSNSKRGAFIGSVHYNVNMTYNGRSYHLNADGSRKTQQQWIEQDILPIFVEAARILQRGSRFILNVADTYEVGDEGEEYKGDNPNFAMILNAVLSLDRGWVYRETKLWIKNYRSPHYPKGSYSPKTPVNNIKHEYLMVFGLESTRLEKPTDDCPTDMTKDQYRQWSDAHWCIAPVSQNRADHEAPYPPRLVNRIMKLYTWPTDWICDPWVGSGTTTAVAADINRRWFGIEIDAERAAHARKRTEASAAAALKRRELCALAEGRDTDDDDDDDPTPPSPRKIARRRTKKRSRGASSRKDGTPSSQGGSKAALSMTSKQKP